MSDRNQRQWGALAGGGAGLAAAGIGTDAYVRARVGAARADDIRIPAEMRARVDRLQGEAIRLRGVREEARRRGMTARTAKLEQRDRWDGARTPNGSRFLVPNVDAPRGSTYVVPGRAADARTFHASQLLHNLEIRREGARESAGYAAGLRAAREARAARGAYRAYTPRAPGLAQRLHTLKVSGRTGAVLGAAGLVTGLVGMERSRSRRAPQSTWGGTSTVGRRPDVKATRRAPQRVGRAESASWYERGAHWGDD